MGWRSNKYKQWKHNLIEQASHPDSIINSIINYEKSIGKGVELG